MEHSVVADPRIEAATANLSHTYLELGRSSANPHVWSEEGFRACTGSLGHAICNFATDIVPCEQVARRLRAIAERRRCFALYTFPPHDDKTRLQALGDAGFALSHRLLIMTSEKASGDPTQLQEADNPVERRKIAEFMVDQFFHRQPTSFRRGIAEATAAAASLKLFKATWNERTAGAVMISEHSGIVGLYNLCVAPQFRRRGWGSAIVRTIAGRASETGRNVTLQCEPSLASWYSSLGFKEVGSVSVFGLCRFKEIDIMG